MSRATHRVKCCTKHKSIFFENGGGREEKGELDLLIIASVSIVIIAAISFPGFRVSGFTSGAKKVLVYSNQSEILNSQGYNLIQDNRTVEFHKSKKPAFPRPFCSQR